MATLHEVDMALRADPRGRAAANRIVERIAGTCSLGKVDPKHYPAILRALESNAPEDDDTPLRAATVEDIQPESIYARWNSCRRNPNRG